MNPSPWSICLPDQTDVFQLSALLQHPTSPTCLLNAPCEKPTITHHPDLAIMYVEPQHLLPNHSNPFQIPVLLPESYVLLVYAHSWDIISCKRNPYTGTIDIEHETIHMQQDGDTFQDKMYHICETIIKIIVKQLTTGKRLIELAIPHHRQNGCDGLNMFHIYKTVCIDCWCIDNPRDLSRIFYNNPNNIPSFE